MRLRRVGQGLPVCVLGLALALMAPQPAAAQQDEPGTLAVSFRNLTLEQDSIRVRQRQADRPAAATPTDTLRYELVFTNSLDREARNVVFTNSMPVGLVLIGGSVDATSAATIAYSIDGGRTYSAQPMVFVTEQGRQVQQPAPPEAYTHIRWTVASVPARDKVTATFDARVGARPGTGR